jgi:large subunit ribosomal protein L5
MLKKFYSKNFRYELINKFICKSSRDLLELKKITLNFGCQTADAKKLASSLLALELITNQKGILTKTKYSNILFKIRKGNPTGCKVTLRNENALNFIYKMLIEVFPRLKSFYGFTLNKKLNVNNFSFQLKETFSFSDLESRYYLFNHLPNLDISIKTNATTEIELRFILNFLKIPIIK